MRKRQRGITLLEIMIVLAILALVMGLVIGPKLIEHYHHAQRDLAKLAVDKYADEDFPQWAVQHPADQCPAGLAELSTNPKKPNDPWGSAYKMHCGPNAPATNIAFGAASFGEDRSEGTTDDIRSWE